MRLGIKKSVYNDIIKSFSDNKLEYFKKEIIKILEKHNDISKSFSFQLFMIEKSALGVGHVSVYKDGSMWKKIQNDPPKWKCVRQAKTYNAETTGAKQSITKLINKVRDCNSIEDLYEIVMANSDRFRDSNGTMLPIVQKLKNAVDERQEQINDAVTRVKPLFEPRINENGVLEETELEEKLSDIELKKKIKNFARKNLQGGYVKNLSNGERIIISRDGIDEWESKSKSREQILSLKMLDYLLRNGKYDHSDKENKGKRDVKDYDYYKCDCKINGQDYTAIITIRNSTGSDNKYYHHYLEDIKIKPSSTSLHPAEKQRDAVLLEGSNKKNNLSAKRNISQSKDLSSKKDINSLRNIDFGKIPSSTNAQEFLKFGADNLSKVTDKNAKQYGGLTREKFNELLQKKREIDNKPGILSPSDIDFLININEKAIEDMQYQINVNDNEVLKNSTSSSIIRALQGLNQLHDWFDLSKNQEKFFNKQWKDYFAKYPEKFNKGDK